MLVMEFVMDGMIPVKVRILKLEGRMEISDSEDSTLWVADC